MGITSQQEASRLLRLQIGQESTWGDGATATSILHGTVGVPTIVPHIKNTQFESQLGTLTPFFDSAQLSKGGTFAITGRALFEDLLYMLGMAYGLPTPTGAGTPLSATAISEANPTHVTISGHGLTNGQEVIISGSNSTPSINGLQTITVIDKDTVSVPVHVTVAGTAASIYTQGSWAFVAPVAGAFDPLSLAMELVNTGSGKGVKASGCLLQTWSLKGEQSKEVTLDAKGFFKSFSEDVTMTAGLPFRETETILTPEVALSLDVALATPGTTAFPATMVTFEFSGTTGLKPLYAAGEIEPSDFTFEKQDLGLKLGLLYTDALKSYFNDNPVAGLPIVAQLKATSGEKSLTMPYSGVVKTDPTVFGDSQGAQLLELELGPQYDTALANYFSATLVNGMVTLP